MAATGMEAGAAAGVGVPLLGLDLGCSDTVGAGLSIRLLPGTILLRATSGAGLRLGARARLAQRTLGIPPRVALLVNESPPRGGLSALETPAPLLPLAHVDEVSGDRGRRRHYR